MALRAPLIITQRILGSTELVSEERDALLHLMSMETLLHCVFH